MNIKKVIEKYDINVHTISLDHDQDWGWCEITVKKTLTQRENFLSGENENKNSIRVSAEIAYELAGAGGYY